MSKRPHKETEFANVEEVTSPSGNAKVHGVIMSLSPIKTKGTTGYFDGEITDGKKKMRLYGFDSADGVRRKLLEYNGTEKAVALSKCEIKPSRDGNSLEIKIDKRTEVSTSQKKFDQSQIEAMTEGKFLKLSDLQKTPEFQLVSVAAKVTNITDPSKVANGKLKQDITIADASSSARFTIWEEEIGNFDLGKSYNICSIKVREFRDIKYLTTSQGISQYSLIDDIGPVADTDEGSKDQYHASNPRNARIMGVHDLHTFNSCINCHGKVVPQDDDPELCKCTKCQMVQLYEACNEELSVRLLLKSDAEEDVTLRAFTDIIFKILDKSRDDFELSQITPYLLLKAQPFSFQHSGGIIQAIHRS